MLAKKFRIALATTVAIPLFAVAAPAMGQVVNAGDLQDSYDSAGNPGQIVVTNPNASTANVSVLAPVVVANWNQFNVPANTTLNVSNASAAAQASLLNRVIGGSFSDISGTINAAGVNLWLINQNGILFGDTASVSASSFFASTADVSDADFFDFYEGTNLAGNGTANVRFQTNPAATTFIGAFGGTTSSPRFVTDGTLLFVGPALNLTGTFDAGTGKASFIAATDVEVTFNVGSPVGYTITAGTTVADQMIDGSIAGNSTDFVFALQSSTGVLNGLLTVDADVATNAVSTDRGIYLFTTGNIPASVTVGGAWNSSGGIETDVNGDLTISQNASGSYANVQATGDITTQGISATSFGIDIDSTGAGDISVGALNAVTDVAIDTSGGQLSGTSVNASGNFTVGAFAEPNPVTFTGNITAGTVDIESGGALTLEDVTATAGRMDLAAMGALNAGTLTATGLVAVNTSGSVTLDAITADSDGTGGEGVALGNVTTPASIVIAGTTSGGSATIRSLNNIALGNVTSTAGLIDIDTTNGSLSAGAVSATGGDARLTAVTSVTTTSINSTAAIDVDSTASGNLNLGNLNAGTTINLDTGGAVAFGSANASGLFAIGASVDPSSITATGNVVVGSVDFDSVNALNTTNITATAGGIDIDARSTTAGALSAATGITVDGTGAVNLASATADSDNNNSGVLVIGGNVRPSALTVAGTSKGTAALLQAVGNVSLGSVTSTVGTTDVYSTNGGITAGAVSAAGAAIVRARGGITTTAITSAGSIDVDSLNLGALDLGNLSSGSMITLDTAGTLRFGNVTTPNQLSIGSVFVPTSIVSSGTIIANRLDVRTTGGLNFVAANQIDSLGTISAGGPVAINSTKNLSIGGPVTAIGQDVTLTSSGNLTIGSTGTVTGKIVAVSGTGNFTNQRGADAIAASDHWVVYSNAPAGNTFGNLDSGNTAIWNAAIATLAPTAVSGNRYVFAYQPTLTVSSTSLSKVYGTDLTGMLNGYYTVSGFQPGVAGAYLADTAANILTGAPTVTSAGAAERAVVAGSPYVMDVELGTLAASRGYAIALSDAGTLTVTPKPVSASVAANDKTYDGTTAGTGDISSTGFLVGDDVTITGTTYTFSDKNAGTDKTVTIGGATLSGSDAGNYTLTIPTSMLADIFAKAISASVVADDKTYDGTTAAIGSLTLNGVVAGDDLGTSGTTFTFADKNAGADKTVTVSGTTLTGTDAGNYVLTVPATTLADIFARSIGATVTADHKTYDGTTSATGSVTLTGVLAGDDLSTSGTTFTFSDKNTGTDKTVTVSGTTLTGADAGNYVVTVPASTLADIFAKAISATVSANDKTYDGTTAATGSVSLIGVVAGDSVGTAGTAFTFSDKNVGADKTVAVGGTTLTGTDAGNYALTVPTSTLADIFVKTIMATVAADDKTYDGTTAGTGSVSLLGVVTGDSVATNGTTFAFADKNAGIDKTVIIGGTTLTGADAGNYTVSVPTSAMADILAKAITATATANDKIYDGTTMTTGALTLNGVVAGDSVNTTGTAFAFANKNAGTDKIVTASGAMLTGAEAGNYTLTGTATALADILAKAITGSVNVSDKVYDGTTAATGTVTLTGVVAGDAVSTTGTTFAFVDQTAGTDKTVRVGGTALAGADSGNYTLTLPATALADILKRAIEIVALDGSKLLGQVDPALAFTVGGAGLIAGDSLTGALQRAPGENVGTYAIGQGSLTAGANYTITFTGGTFTVRPASVPNTLRTTQLPSEVDGLRGGSGVTIEMSDLCPEDDKYCAL
ncbi:filamentous hemagglutinin N-terminal domain-containing protein [Qipengyuania sp. GH25]|uniref:Filamentous hemagglutinin N-terminal domain-containing protein n=1 Tax=Qipengyuania pacifica TaxID=2860199 RepID=A0ABS7JKD1_9SPHN|nr:YDG domain-containing protein [Qipengyuania aerophila]MBX7489857.1 filamentous hemagglutinin N-terminal domain-containing protein [Qipengyuania aerophila]